MNFQYGALINASTDYPSHRLLIPQIAHTLDL